MKTQIACFALFATIAGCAGSPSDTTSADDSVAPDGKEDSLTAGKFETFTGKDGKFYFHMLAGNGQKVLQSQGYTTLASAKKGIASVTTNGQYSDAFQVLEAQDGRYYFNLLAGNWEIIATSQMYASKSNADRAVATVVSLVTKLNPVSAAPTGARFATFKGLDGKYYFDLRAGNGEIVLQSQAYTRKASAVDGSTSVSNNGNNPAHYQLKDAVNGQTYFVLIASNGEVIGVSETYVSRSNAQAGIDAVVALLGGSESIAAAQ